MEKVQPYYGSYVQRISVISESQSLLNASLEVVEECQKNTMTIKEAESRVEFIIEQVCWQKNEGSLYEEAVRDILINLLSTGVDSCSRKIQKILLELLSYETLSHDILNEQMQPLFSLEESLSLVIEQEVRKEIADKDRFLELLQLYDRLLEHIWLLRNMTSSPAEEVFFDQKISVTVRKAKEWRFLLKQELGVIPGLTRVFVGIERTIKRMEVPLHPAHKTHFKSLIQGIQHSSFRYNLAELFSSLKEYDKALLLFEEALRMPPGQFENITPKMQAFRIGRASVECCKIGDYQRAIFWYEQQLNITEKMGYESGQLVAYNGLGLAHRRLRNFEKALAYYYQALGLALKLQPMERFKDAPWLYHEAKKAALDHLDYLPVQKIYVSLGNTYESMGESQPALNNFQFGMQLAIQLDFDGGLAQALLGLGRVYNSRGNYSKAMGYFENALAIVQLLGDRALEGRVFGDLGRVYEAMGGYSEALECHEEDLKIAKDLKDKAGEGCASGNLGTIYQRMENYEEAIDLHNKHFEIAEELKDEAGIGKASGNLGNAHDSLGNYSEAIEYHTKSLEIARALKDQRGESESLAGLGNVYMHLDDYNEAIKHIQKALLIAPNLKNIETEGGLHNNLGMCYKKIGNYSKAEEHFRKGIKIYSDIQDSLVTKYSDKIRIFERQATAYYGLEETLLLRNKHSEALLASDARRSRTLIGEIQAKHASHFTNAPLQVEEMQKLAELLGTTIVVYTLAQGIKQELGIWVIRPKDKIVHRSTESPNIKRLFRERKRITPFQDIDSDECTKRDGIEDLFESLPSQGLVNQAKSEQIAFLQDWYNELVYPIFEDLPKEQNARIVFVPDFHLLEVPFALLMNSDKAYLFEKYTISITSSVKTLFCLTRRLELAPKLRKSLIVGNPTTLDKSSLPLSSEEAKVVAEVTGTSPERILIECKALKSTVLAGLEGSRFIHFACHGEVKAKGKHSIYDGAFYLTPDEENSDGILYAEEIVNCELNAELVLLSACHSGKGKLRREGVIGPVRSFLAAGAQAVVATLWALPDSELTIAMVSQFYEHILGKSKEAEVEGRPLDKDEALREVMRMAVSEGVRNRPQEWGAFFMTGALKPRTQDRSLDFDKRKHEEV